LPPLARWEALLGRARRGGRLVGVDRRAFPRDFAVFTRYNRALRRLRPLHPLPDPMTIEELDEFLMASRDRYAVRWQDETVAAGLRPHS
jgi:hypothetical protein